MGFEANQMPTGRAEFYFTGGRIFFASIDSGYCPGCRDKSLDRAGGSFGGAMQIGWDMIPVLAMGAVSSGRQGENRMDLGANYPGGLHFLRPFPYLRQNNNWLICHGVGGFISPTHPVQISQLYHRLGSAWNLTETMLPARSTSAGSSHGCRRNRRPASGRNRRRWPPARRRRQAHPRWSCRTPRSTSSFTRLATCWPAAL